MLKFAQALFLSVLPLVCVAAADTAAGQSPQVAAGQRLYEEGLLTSGEPLVARLNVGVTLTGRDAACARCHRVSGSGGFEGGNLIPPITGPELFDKRARRETIAGVSSGIEREDFWFVTRPPYDRAALGKALRSGVAPGGHQLSDLMPRYNLSKRDLAALSRYLHQLSRHDSPGYDGQTMDFATVLTPEANPLDRQGLVETLQACFRERYPEDRKDGMRWRLNVWQLEGEPASWDAQLAKFQASRPAFAVVSGVGGAEWEPVHRYCERTKLPCLFPSVDVPGAREPSRYSFYFSAGTLLEADVMINWLGKRRDAMKPGKVLQLVAGESVAGERGAAALARQAQALGIATQQLSYSAATAAGISAAIAGLGPEDALVLWLPRDDLNALSRSVTLPARTTVIASGWLGDATHLDLSPEWHQRITLVYDLDPPARLEQRMNFNLRPWVSANGIAPAREMVLGNALTSCLLLAEGISAQKGALTRDKLIEQIENYPTAMGNAPAPQVFHEFSLGPGQRFSSKGAYIVRFKGDGGNHLEPVSDWITP